jgi:replicative DNA helicase
MRDFATRFEGRFGCGELPGIGTGLPLLDATTGGFQRRVLSLVAARTGVGKTAFGLQVGWAAIKAESARRVAIYSLEMSDAMLSDRLVGSVSGVGLFLVKNPQMSTARQRDAIAAAVSEIGSLGNRLVVNDRVADLRTIEAEVRREARNGLDLVIVDYIQLVRGGKGERRYAEVGDISSRLVTLAKESGAAVVGLAQLGRDAGSRKPCLTDLRESGNLEQDARLVLLLDRPRRRGESAPECQAWVNIAKHSEGESGAEIALHFAGELQRFEEDAEADVTACPFCRGGQR